MLKLIKNQNEDLLVTWKKGKNRAKVEFLVSECGSSSSCELVVTTLFLGLVNWLEKQGMMVLVPKQYLQSKELSDHRVFQEVVRLGWIVKWM